MSDTRRSSVLSRVVIIGVVLFLACASVGCVGYEAYSPSPTGTFYPNEPVRVRGRDVNDLLSARTNIYAIRGPVRISEVGIATYHDPQNAGKHEVARLEFSDGGIYVWTDTLREVGRIEYSGKQGAASKFWIRFTDFFKYVWVLIKFLVGLAILLLILSLFSGGGGGTWSGGGTTSTGGSWHGGGSFSG